MAKRSVKNKSLPELSKAQLQIMEVVWEKGEVSAYEVHERLCQNREISPTTVRTMMQRLEKKGWLTFREVGRTYLYSAPISRDEGIGNRVIEFVDTVCGGSAEELVSTLLDAGKISNAELDRIRKLIDNAKKKSKPIE